MAVRGQRGHGYSHALSRAHRRRRRQPRMVFVVRRPRSNAVARRRERPRRAVGRANRRRVRAKDVGSGVVTTEHIDKPVDVLTIALRPTSKSAATMDIEWENTR